MTNLQGPGSDPNPVGNLTQMRQVSYMMDMERGPGSSPIAGQQNVGANQIVRGSGIIDKSFQGIKIDQFGIHLYGETVTRAIFIREADGTLSATLTRTNTKVDSGSTGSAGTILLTTTDHEVFIDSNGHEIRVGGDLYPATDSARDLGEISRRWKNIHTDLITFSDASIIGSFKGYSANRVLLTIGATILADYQVYMHTDGKVYPATRAKQEFVIGVSDQDVSGGTSLIRMHGFFEVGIAGAAITPGDLLRIDTITAGRIVNGAAYGNGDVVGIALSSAGGAGNAFAYMTVRA